MDYLGLIVPRCLPLPECSAPFRPLIASASAPAFSHSPLSPPSFFPPPSLTPRVRIHPLPTPPPLFCSSFLPCPVHIRSLARRTRHRRTRQSLGQGEHEAHGELNWGGGGGGRGEVKGGGERGGGKVAR